jgi:hypothetical protein
LTDDRRVLVRRRRSALLQCVALLVFVLSAAPLRAWGPQGHRLVALVATRHLSATALRNVAWLLGDRSLADVAVWADDYLTGNNQTSFWHYVNIPADATSYDRDRDCPTQPGVRRGDRLDRWRDCAVDRILYNQERLATASLDRADRAVALKFLVHVVGDLHQPFHALGVERGGNGIPVSAFGSPTCNYNDGTSYPCNLHSIWDSTLVAHRQLDDRQYLAALEQRIAQNRWEARSAGSPADWAMQSHDLARGALLPPEGLVDETYHRAHIATVDERLALAGLRLAALLNGTFTSDPPVKVK